jgi:hypothetical protein
MSLRYAEKIPYVAQFYKQLVMSKLYLYNQGDLYCP